MCPQWFTFNGNPTNSKRPFGASSSSCCCNDLDPSSITGLDPRGSRCADPTRWAPGSNFIVGVIITGYPLKRPFLVVITLLVTLIGWSCSSWEGGYPPCKPSGNDRSSQVIEEVKWNNSLDLDSGILHPAHPWNSTFNLNIDLFILSFWQLLFKHHIWSVSTPPTWPTKNKNANLLDPTPSDCGSHMEGYEG